MYLITKNHQYTLAQPKLLLLSELQLGNVAAILYMNKRGSSRGLASSMRTRVKIKEGSFLVLIAKKRKWGLF